MTGKPPIGKARDAELSKGRDSAHGKLGTNRHGNRAGSTIGDLSVKYPTTPTRLQELRRLVSDAKKTMLEEQKQRSRGKK